MDRQTVGLCESWCENIKPGVAETLMGERVIKARIGLNVVGRDAAALHRLRS